MAIKDILKKLLIPTIENNEKKREFTFSKKINLVIYPTILLISFIVYSATYNSINNQKNENKKNLESFFDSNELENLTVSFFENLKSPYKEFNYKIENNDSLAKILRKFRISDNEISEIIEGLKLKKLTNIYAGRELNIILKKLDDKTNSIVNILYPINNTLSVEIRKNKNIIEIKENILKLNKKEVV